MNNLIQYRNLFLIVISISFFSCGDLLSYKKQITEKYYIMETNTKNNLAIYYKTNDGDFIGRIKSKILEYGFNDSFLIAKCKQNDTIKYYIINRNKDSDFADEKDFLIVAPLTEKKFNEEWQQRLKITFIKSPTGAGL